MSLACETCRAQTRALVRTAIRAGASRAAAAPPTSFFPPARAFSSVPARKLGKAPPRKLLEGLRTSIAEPYRVLSATEQLFNVASRAANYHITEEERKQERVQLAEDGEEIGHSLNPDEPWHGKFKLPPTFSTWSHVTMLHLWLINTRLRCYDKEVFHNWQHQLTDHFFFECEKKMHIDHHITSSAMRQRYLKDIFVQWRGLLLAYDEGLIKGDAILASAVWRNLFKGSADVDPRILLSIVGWIRSSLKQLENASDGAVASEVLRILVKPADAFWEFKPLGKPSDAAPSTASSTVQPRDVEEDAPHVDAPKVSVN